MAAGSKTTSKGTKIPSPKPAQASGKDSPAQKPDQKPVIRDYASI